MNNITDTNNTQTKSGELAIALFAKPSHAQDAFRDLLSRGYKQDDIIVMMSEETEKKHFLPKNVSTTELGSKSLEGTAIGGTIGGAIGAVAAGIAAMGTLVAFPGGIVIAGPIAAALAVGGLVGGLIGLGVSDDLAKEFEGGINEGGIVIGVYTKNPDDYNLLHNHWKTYQSDDSMPIIGL